MNTDALNTLSPPVLRTLAASLREGALSCGITQHGVARIAGGHGAAVHACLQGLADDGMASRHIASLVDAVARARQATSDREASELVLSGPDLPGIPTRDTAAVMHTLIENARREIVLVGYAVHNGKQLFARLAERMADDPSLTVTMYLNIERPRGDTSLTSEMARRFAHDFRARHWPWDQLPELYYDARSLAEETDQRVSLHAKCIITDRESALVTSANFTKAAQQRNIEVGILIRDAATARTLSDYFTGLQATVQLVPCPLPE